PEGTYWIVGRAVGGGEPGPVPAVQPEKTAFSAEPERTARLLVDRQHVQRPDRVRRGRGAAQARPGTYPKALGAAQPEPPLAVLQEGGDGEGNPLLLGHACDLAACQPVRPPIERADPHRSHAIPVHTVNVGVEPL